MSMYWKDQSRKMDHMYRYARHIYDASRKYYLLGRDALLDQMVQHPADRVLEVGCGTARNLICLAARLPQAQLFGLDASGEMLCTANRSVLRAGFSRRVALRQGLAEELDHFYTFGISQPFDAVFFSYSLSMIPSWPHALAAALRNLRPGGRLYVVDFWDQADLPGWFARFLQHWLASFDVFYRPELLVHLQDLAAQKVIDLNVTPFARRYAFIAQAVCLQPVRKSSVAFRVRSVE